MKTQFHKHVMVGNSQLKDALDSGDKKAADKIFNDTGARFTDLYGPGDARWFAQMSAKYATTMHVDGATLKNPYTMLNEAKAIHHP